VRSIRISKIQEADVRYVYRQCGETQPAAPDNTGSVRCTGRVLSTELEGRTSALKTVMAREQNLKYGNYCVILFSSKHYRDKDIYKDLKLKQTLLRPDVWRAQ
jgi:hypothetical protein